MTELKATEAIEQLFEILRVDAVFGQPIQEGDVTIIPVAELGGVFDYGSGQSPATEEEGDTADGGNGAGGGGGGKAKPRGYIKITSDGVNFESVLDEDRVALAGIAMSAWAIFWVAKTIRAFVTR